MYHNIYNNTPSCTLRELHKHDCVKFKLMSIKKINYCLYELIKHINNEC